MVRNRIYSYPHSYENLMMKFLFSSIFDENIPVPFFLTDQIHLAYRSYIVRNIKGSEKNSNNKQYLGNVPFTIYFEFKITTGDTVFFDPKMLVIKYCQIYTFHPSLNLEKIVIFRSFQQSAEEIYDLGHFKRQHVEF